MSVHNGEMYLREAIDSVLAQEDCCEFELIVIDDASTDSTSKILHAFNDDRLIIISVKENVGLVNALNLAAEKASGQLLARMDADDAYLPSKLSKQCARFATEPELVFLATGFEYFDEASKVFDVVYAQSDDRVLRSALMNEGNQFCHASIMMRADAFRAVGGYRKLAGRYSQDYDLWLRLMEVGKIDALPEPLVRYRVHADMISITKLPLQRRAAEIYKCLAKQRSVGEIEDIARAELELLSSSADQKEALAKDYLRWNHLFHRMGQHSKARLMFIKAAITAPFSRTIRQAVLLSMRSRLRHLLSLRVFH